MNKSSITNTAAGSSHPPANPNRVQGFTLVEVMVSLTLGLFLLTMSMQAMLGINKSFTSIKRAARMQETARFAFALISNDIKQSRYWAGILAFSSFGGSSALADINASNCLEGGTSWGRQIQQPIFAINNSAFNYACVSNDDYIAGDVLTLRGALTAKISSYDNEQIYIKGNGAQHRLFLGVDRALAVNNDLANTVSQQVFAHSYFVGDSNRTCKSSTVPALFWQTLVNGRPQKEELLAGVEQLQVSFAVDLNQDDRADSYLNAAQVINWQSVLSVKIDLLIRSACPDMSHQDNNTYQIGDVNYQVNDHFIRQQYQYTYSFR